MGLAARGRPNAPDWLRRGLRLALALWGFTFTGATLWPLADGETKAIWGDELRQSCNWGAATCAVVAASPLIGKVVQLSGERTLGTVMGGALGYVVFDHVYKNPLLPDVLDVPILSTSAALVGLLSCWLSQRFKLDASMRLFVITFVLVTFGAHPENGALMVALLRTGGIFVGVLVFMVLTVVVLPKSASIEALRESRKSLRLLVDLSAVVAASWEPAAAADAAAAAAAGAKPGPNGQLAAGALERQPSLLSRAVSLITGGGGGSGGGRANGAGLSEPLLGEAGRFGADEAGESSAWRPMAGAEGGSTGNGGAAGGGGTAGAVGVALGSGESHWDEELEAKYEQTLADIYTSVFKMKELLSLSQNELFVFHGWGHPVVLPLFGGGSWAAWLAGASAWRPPAAALGALSTSVRRMARLLYTLHLGYADALSAAACPGAACEQLRAAPGALRAAAGHLDGALRALAGAYPCGRRVVVDELRAFSSAVDGLLDISTASRAAVIEQLARSRPRPHHPMRELEQAQRAASLSLDLSRALRPGAGGLGAAAVGAPASGFAGGATGGAGGAGEGGVEFVTQDGSCLPRAVRDWLKEEDQGPASQRRWPAAAARAAGRPVQVSLLSAVLRRNQLAPRREPAANSAASAPSGAGAGRALSDIIDAAVAAAAAGHDESPGDPSSLQGPMAAGAAAAHSEPPAAGTHAAAAAAAAAEPAEPTTAAPPNAAAAGAGASTGPPGAGGAGPIAAAAAASHAAAATEQHAFSAPSGAVSPEQWLLAFARLQQAQHAQQGQGAPHGQQGQQQQRQEDVAAAAAAAVTAALTNEVRFFSVQLVLEEMVDELEELYLSASRVMEGLPPYM